MIGVKSQQGSRRRTCGWITSFLRENVGGVRESHARLMYSAPPVADSRSTPNRQVRKNLVSPSRSPLRYDEFDSSGHELVSWSLHPTGLDLIFPPGNGRHGAVAQLGERLICTQEVAGSIPTSSTSCESRACSSAG